MYSLKCLLIGLLNKFLRFDLWLLDSCLHVCLRLSHLESQFFLNLGFCSILLLLAPSNLLLMLFFEAIKFLDAISFKICNLLLHKLAWVSKLLLRLLQTTLKLFPSDLILWSLRLQLLFQLFDLTHELWFLTLPHFHDFAYFRLNRVLGFLDLLLRIGLSFLYFFLSSFLGLFGQIFSCFLCILNLLLCFLLFC